MPEIGKHKIPTDVKKDINYWRLVVPEFNGSSYIPVNFWSKQDSWISTDACVTGGGGYFNGEYFHFSFSANLIAVGKFINQFKLFVLWKVVEH